MIRGGHKGIITLINGLCQTPFYRRNTLWFSKGNLL